MAAERLNELLDVRVSWVDELRGMRKGLKRSELYDALGSRAARL
jgi:hypothetical protein